MSKKNQTESVVVVDRSSRRQFFRVGAAFVVGATAFAGEALADCDQNPQQKTRCTDKDSGQNGDPPGCGRCGRLVPTSMPQSRDAEPGRARKIPRTEKIIV